MDFMAYIEHIVYVHMVIMQAELILLMLFVNMDYAIKVARRFNEK